MTKPAVECIFDAKNLVGESPVWRAEEDSVYWTDVNGFRVHRLDLPSGDHASWRFDGPVSTLALTTDPDRLLVAVGARLLFWNPKTGERTAFVQPEPDWPAHRLNDGAPDPSGNFWVGSMRNNVAADGGHVEASGESGSLYRVSPSGAVTMADTGFGISNTIVWSPDVATFYTACSTRNILYAYDYDRATGTIANRREFAAKLSYGVPDGSAIDAEGYLWNCRFFGGCILRLSPEGAVDRVIEMPVSNITNCAFGGPELDRLYITTASMATRGDEANAGGLFVLNPGVKGLPPEKFASELPRVPGL